MIPKSGVTVDTLVLLSIDLGGGGQVFIGILFVVLGIWINLLLSCRLLWNALTDLNLQVHSTPIEH